MRKHREVKEEEIIIGVGIRDDIRVKVRWIREGNLIVKEEVEANIKNWNDYKIMVNYLNGDYRPIDKHEIEDNEIEEDSEEDRKYVREPFYIIDSVLGGLIDITMDVTNDDKMTAWVTNWNDYRKIIDESDFDKWGEIKKG